MAPLHHHFELKGWDEITVVIRFWIITGLCVAAGLGHLLRRVGRRRMSDPRSTPSAGATPGTASARSSPGIGVSGFAAADNLTHLGAARHRARRVGDDGDRGEKADAAGDPRRRRPARRGATARPPRRRRPASSPRPGWRPTRRCSRRPRARGVPVWGEVELAWRLRDPRARRAVAGASPAPTARPRRCRCSTSILRAAGLRTRRRAATSGLPVVEAVMDPEPYDVLAVELSSFQLHYTHVDARASPRRCSTSPRTTSTGTVLAWRTTPPTRAGSTSASERACVYNVADPVTEELVREADVVEGARAVGFTLGVPGRRHGRRRRRRAGRPGLRRAAAAQRRRAVHASPTWPPPAPALRRQRAGRGRAGPRARRAARPRSATGCAPSGPRPPHRRRRRRSTAYATSTTPRPPTRTPPPSSLQAYDPVVWVAGGLAKGASFDDLVHRRRATGCAASCSSAATAR